MFEKTKAFFRWLTRKSQQSKCNASDAPVKPEEVDSELNAVVKPIQTKAEWNEFSRNIQAEGFPVAWDSSEMSELGKKYLDERITSEECVRNIRKIAEEAAQVANEAAASEYWNELAVRLRLESELNKPEEEIPVEALAPMNVETGRSSRPKKGWFFTNYVRLDQKLQDFLKTKLDFVRSVLESERFNVRDVKIATELRLLLVEVEDVQELLKNAPVLDARTAALRVEKTTPTEMVKVMNQAITAAEYLEAAVKSHEILRTFPLPCELKNALRELKIQVENRSRIR